VRFAELAAAAGVGRLVKLSQFAADETSPVRFLRYHAAVERRIRELGIAFTFLRPNLYFQGLLAFQPMIASEGHFIAPIGDARVSAVDVRDIAAVAATALIEEGHEGKTYTITGPAAVTHTEMAGALSKAIGRSVTFMDVPSEAFASALKAAGLPPWQVDGLVEDYAHYARGEAQATSPHVRERSQVLTRVTWAGLLRTMRARSVEPGQHENRRNSRPDSLCEGPPQTPSPPAARAPQAADGPPGQRTMLMITAP
jgi:uncharacterized protein YbjT (DUF2867 family)